MIANRAIKARAKVSPDRIQDDIRNHNVIKGLEILDNELIHLAESEDLNMAALATEPASLPLSFWLDHKQELLSHFETVAVQIAADEVLEDITSDLDDIDIIVLPFVNFVDGRSYSHASRLRSQFGYSGEIRAVGDVHFDQLRFLARCGCDAFELPDSDNQEQALTAFTEFSEVYQPAADGTHLIFSRRRRVH